MSAHDRTRITLFELRVDAHDDRQDLGIADGLAILGVEVYGKVPDFGKRQITLRANLVPTTGRENQSDAE